MARGIAIHLACFLLRKQTKGDFMRTRHATALVAIWLLPIMACDSESSEPAATGTTTGTAGSGGTTPTAGGGGGTAGNGTGGAGGTNRDPLQPYAANPWYWEYHGEPVLLFGGSDADSIFHWASEGTKLTDHLDELVSAGGNYIRCTMNSRHYTPDGYDWDYLPYPYERLGSGLYDLGSWDETYWNNLRTTLAETHARGIFVQLEIWDRWNEWGNSYEPGGGWYDSPWNPDNNVNYGWSDSPLLSQGSTGFYNAFHEAALHNDPVLLPVQQAYVRKIVDTVVDGGFDHVLFQTDNESGIGDLTLEPDPYWAEFIRDYALNEKQTTVYVTISRRFHSPGPYVTTNFQDPDNPEISVPIDHPTVATFLDISQNNGNSGQTQYDNLLWYRSLAESVAVRPINHVKCYHFDWPTGTSFHDRTSPTDAEAGAKFWKPVFAGAASIRFHRHTDYQPGGLMEGFGLQPEGKMHIASMRLFVDEFDLFTSEPHNDLLTGRSDNEAYCLATPGAQYAVYFTGNADCAVTLDLSAASSSLSLRWLDIEANTLEPPTSVPPAAPLELTCPDAGPWVAILTG